MNKRPICLFCIGYLIFLYLMNYAGIFSLKDAGMDILTKEYLEGGKQETISGEIDDIQFKKDKTNLYLKNINQIQSNPANLKNTNQIQSNPENSKNTKINGICLISIENTDKDNYEILQKLRPGYVVQINARLYPISEPTNPGQFDSAFYYSLEEVYCRGQAEQIKILKTTINFLKDWPFQIRKKCSQTLYGITNSENADILSALLLGNKSMLEEDVKTGLQIAGVFHLFCVSGLHISIIGMAVFCMMKKMGISLRIAVLFSAVLLLFYSVMTGMAPGTVRALIMFGVMLGAKETGRSYDSMTALAFCVLLLVMWKPALILYGGFLLSVGAVLGITLLYPMFTSGKKVGRLMASLGTMASVWIVTLPVIACFYYELPVYSFFFNLLLLPCASVLLTSGFLGMLLGSILPIAGKVAIYPAGILCRLIFIISELSGRLPFCSWICGCPKMARVLGYYGLGCAILILKNVRKNHAHIKNVTTDNTRMKWPNVLQEKFLIVIAVSFMLLILFFPISEGTQVCMLDVGQGDCTFIHTSDQESILIDGGSSSVEQVGKYRILPFLKWKGIQTLDYVIISHPDEDHMNGIRELMNMILSRKTALRIKNLILPKWERNPEEFQEIEEAAWKMNTRVYYLGKGDCIRSENVCMSVLHPGGGDYRANTNAGSLVIDYMDGDFHALFTGDMEMEQEIDVMEQVKNMESLDLLKVAHHGSKTASCEVFIKWCSPEISFISCGKNNRYGHPAQVTLDILEQYKTQIYRTDQMGALMLFADEEKIRIEVFTCPKT